MPRDTDKDFYEKRIKPMLIKEKNLQDVLCFTGRPGSEFIYVVYEKGQVPKVMKVRDADEQKFPRLKKYHSDVRITRNKSTLAHYDQGSSRQVNKRRLNCYLEFEYLKEMFSYYRMDLIENESFDELLNSSTLVNKRMDSMTFLINRVDSSATKACILFKMKLHRYNNIHELSADHRGEIYSINTHLRN